VSVSGILVGIVGLLLGVSFSNMG